MAKILKRRKVKLMNFFIVILFFCEESLQYLILLQISEKQIHSKYVKHRHQKEMTKLLDCIF